MNTPQQQAELYRKAAETIEMCEKHGVDPKMKFVGTVTGIAGSAFLYDIKNYEFPVAVIEGQLVWADTVVYNRIGLAESAKNMHTMFNPYTLTPPKQPLCEVEGKPVYKGDKLYCKAPSWCKSITVTGISDGLLREDSLFIHPDGVSWSQPKRTVMVEMLEEDAKYFSDAFTSPQLTRLASLCRKSLDNLKGS